MESQTVSKYYTPEAEEFYIGFEYESLQDPRYPEKDNSWESNYIESAFELKTFLGYYCSDNIELRVKYLDKEDIESLGFHTEDNGECYNKSIKWVEIGLYPWASLTGIKHQYKIVRDGNQVFHGVIKNKSELKKLLKQLNILDGE